MKKSLQVKGELFRCWGIEIKVFRLYKIGILPQICDEVNWLNELNKTEKQPKKTAEGHSLIYNFVYSTGGRQPDRARNCVQTT